MSDKKCAPATDPDFYTCMTSWKDAIPSDDSLKERHKVSVPILVGMIAFGVLLLITMLISFVCWWLQRREMQKAMAGEARVNRSVDSGGRSPSPSPSPKGGRGGLTKLPATTNGSASPNLRKPRRTYIILEEDSDGSIV